MDLRSQVRKFAPYLDRYDIGFGVTLLLIIIVGFATFVPERSVSGVGAGLTRFLANSGMVALITALTAFIALYRFRHRPKKIRPSVHEDFENYDTDAPTDFGLRNFGPGPALYIQAIVTVEQGGNIVNEECFPVHKYPIHLREGDFVSVVPDTEENWLDEMAKKYEIGPSKSENYEPQESPMVNLYFSYVSQSGAREPIHASAERDDEGILDKIKDPDSEARHIPLSRVVEACRSKESLEASP